MNVSGVTFTIRAIDSASSVIGKIGHSLMGLKNLAFNVIGSFKNMFSGLASHITMTMGIGSAGIAAMMGLLVRNSVSLASNFEQAKIAFTGMLGSSAAAQGLLDTLQQFANVTPFEFPQLISATRLLTAYGFKVNELLPTLTAVGDAVSGLGGGAETLNRVMLAMGQIKSKGFLSGEEARQMAEAGINSYQMVAEALGVSIPQAMAMSEKRIINADIALSALVKGMETRFPGMMAMQSQTLQGVSSTLKDIFNTGLRRLGEAATGKLTAMAKGLINILGMVFNDANIERFKHWMDDIFSRDNIQRAATWFANIYVWSRDIFGKMGEYGGKAMNWITKAMHTMHDYMARNLVPMLVRLTGVLIGIKSIEFGMNVANAVARIAGMMPTPAAAAGVLATALPIGFAAAGAMNVAGQVGIAAAAYELMRIRQSLRDLNLPEFPQFGAGASTEEVGQIVNTFMSGFDATMSPLQSAAAQTATNTGIIAQQNKSVLAAIFGNGGDRMQAMATRARFGNLNSKGGGLSVNITVATPQDAERLRYALQLAAQGVR